MGGCVLRRYDGFLLIDAMLSMFIITMLIFTIIPMLDQLDKIYKDKLEQVERIRYFYVLVLDDYEVIESEKNLCIENQLCIKKK